jgi:hypothetical protein
MNAEYDSLKTEKKNGGRKQKAIIRRNKREYQSAFNEEMDEFENEREEGTCQYINKRSNRRCTKPAVSDYEGRGYCRACRSKKVVDDYDMRGGTNKKI